MKLGDGAAPPRSVVANVAPVSMYARLDGVPVSVAGSQGGGGRGGMFDRETNARLQAAVPYSHAQIESAFQYDFDCERDVLAQS